MNSPLLHLLVIRYMDQPGKVVNPAHCQQDRENKLFLSSLLAPENSDSQETESACSFSTLRLNLVLTHGIPPALR